MSAVVRQVLGPAFAVVLFIGIVLAAGLDLRMGRQVAEILHDESTVVVRSTTGAELRVTAAVIPVPIGVLASNTMQLFPLTGIEARGSR